MSLSPTTVNKTTHMKNLHKNTMVTNKPAFITIDVQPNPDPDDIRVGATVGPSSVGDDTGEPPAVQTLLSIIWVHGQE